MSVRLKAVMAALLLVASLNVIVGACSGAERSVSEDAQSLLRKYETTLRPYSRVRARWITKDYDCESGKEPKLTASEEWIFCRDEGRSSFQLLPDGSSKDAKFYENVVERGKTQLAVFPSGSVIGRFKTTADTFAQQLSLLPAAPSFGMIFDKFIPRFFESSPTLATRADVLDGIPVQVIHGSADQIQIQVWLDPQLDYVARKVRAERTEPGLMSVREFTVKRFEKRGSVHVPAEARVDFLFPEQPALSTEVVETVVNGQTVLKNLLAKGDDGKPVMMRAKRQLREISLAQLDFSPTFDDSDFKLKQHIADGTNITMEDARQLRHEWQGGTVTPVAARGVVAAATTASFRNSGSSKLVWLIGANRILLVGLAVVVLYRRWRQGGDAGSESSSL